MLLYFDTTDLDSVLFALINPRDNKILAKKKVTIAYHNSHTTLEQLDIFLKAQNISRSLSADIPAITELIFCSGPGSFTGIRIGASIAQALAFSWNIPLRSIASDQIPKNLGSLGELKLGKKIVIEYGRPAV